MSRGCRSCWEGRARVSVSGRPGWISHGNRIDPPARGSLPRQGTGEKKPRGSGAKVSNVAPEKPSGTTRQETVTRLGYPAAAAVRKAPRV
jgi:hypothetical protein